MTKVDFAKLTDLGRAVSKSDCILIVTDHDEFKELDLKILTKKMRNKILFDTRNCLDHNKWQNEGFSVNVLGDGSKINLGKR